MDNRSLWLPDVFGYSGALPQMMAKCGIDYFMTTKLAWNQFNKMPYDTFKWRGIDGTEILTHLVTTLGVGQSENDFFTTCLLYTSPAEQHQCGIHSRCRC